VSRYKSEKKKGEGASFLSEEERGMKPFSSSMTGEGKGLGSVGKEGEGGKGEFSSPLSN